MTSDLKGEKVIGFLLVFAFFPGDLKKSITIFYLILPNDIVFIDWSKPLCFSMLENKKTLIQESFPSQEFFFSSLAGSM